ncbi:hypothetical protein PWT90_02028 [Aphanocladium album]|nr:hypothetical protein PWT90_02028 [Aphanocladium album]
MAHGHGPYDLRSGANRAKRGKTGSPSSATKPSNNLSTRTLNIGFSNKGKWRLYDDNDEDELANSHKQRGQHGPRRSANQDRSRAGLHQRSQTELEPYSETEAEQDESEIDQDYTQGESDEETCDDTQDDGENYEDTQDDVRLIQKMRATVAKRDAPGRAQDSALAVNNNQLQDSGSRAGRGHENQRSVLNKKKVVFSSNNPFQLHGSSQTGGKYNSQKVAPLNGDLPCGLYDGGEITFNKPAARAEERTPRRRANSALPNNKAPNTSQSATQVLPSGQGTRGGVVRKTRQELSPLKSGRMMTRPGVKAATRAARHKRSKGYRGFFLALATVLLGAYLAWYRQEKIAVGYCGLGRPAKRLIRPNFAVPDLFRPLVELACETCPEHAVCHSNFTVQCREGLHLTPHPLSFGGLVPLPPTCGPGTRAQYVQAIIDDVMTEIRNRRAMYECGKPKKPGQGPVSSPAIPESELKAIVGQKSKKHTPRAEFGELWGAAIDRMTRQREVQVQVATST